MSKKPNLSLHASVYFIDTGHYTKQIYTLIYFNILDFFQSCEITKVYEEGSSKMMMNTTVTFPISYLH